MTVRSVILGLLGAGVVCAVTFFNDRVLRQTHFVGNNMPVSVYGSLILFVALVNPWLRRLALTGRELAVILALTLAACCIPGGGLLRYFTSSLVMPHHYHKTEPAWRDQGVLEMAPKKMLADVRDNENRSLGGFVQGLGEPGRHLSFWDVPWSAWSRTLAFWLPIVLTLWVALIALSVVVHRQWSRHEHLSYPIAAFTDALLPVEGKTASGFFRNRIFWIGALPVLAVHLNNYAFQWFPDYLVAVHVKLDFTTLGTYVPTFTAGGGTGLLAPTIFFSVVGIAFLVPTDVSLAFGVGGFLWAYVVGLFAGYGFQLQGSIEGSSYLALNPRTFLLFGANVGVFLSLVYTGRRHYRSVVARALGLAGGEEATDAEAWACRAFLGLMAVFVLQLCLAGVDWQLAVLYAAALIVGFVVLSRLIAETGLFYVKAYFWPCTIIWGLLGARALGPETLLVMNLVTLVLFLDPREALMPFMVNSLKVLDLRGEKVAPAARWCVLAVVLGLAIAVPVTLYIRYDLGNEAGDRWADTVAPTTPFNNVVAVKQRLTAQGELAEAGRAKGWRRLADASPNPTCMWAAAAGLVMVVLFAAARLRFPWWPLSPLLFVAWAATPIRLFCASFLLGWLVKVSVMKYGGGKLYNRLKPLMMGLIAGEVLGAVFPSIVGAIYYFATGEQPVSFRVLPG
jgi:hypothetical protein